MDIQNSKNFVRTRKDRYNILGSAKFDFEKYGILNRCIPKILFKGNTLLASFLQLIDMRIVMQIKYIDKLKHFKHITWDI